MKTILVLVALSSLVAAPAFAQRAPNASTEVQSVHQQRLYRVHPYAADLPDVYPHSQQLNNNLNPDFQLGGGER
jgi:hypothetical protein